LTEGRAPATAGRVRILSPFDNAVIQRARNQALFDFDYQMECYVPEAKRRFGYFCLPILYRDRLVGRMDCKAHRKEGRLDVKALHLEDGEFVSSHSEELFDKLADAMIAFAEFNRCAQVKLINVFPEHWHSGLDSKLAEHSRNLQPEESS
jgi:uncharacterized protein YcaQ